MGKRSVLRILVVMTAVAVVGPVASAAPVDVRANDPAVDAHVDDGTHIFQFDPVLGYLPQSGGGVVVDLFDRFSGLFGAGNPSAEGFATASASSLTFTDGGKLDGGSDKLMGDATAAWNAKFHTLDVAVRSCFTPTGQCPPAFTSGTVASAGSSRDRSSATGPHINWSPFVDIWESIPIGDTGFCPWITVDDNPFSAHYGQIYVSWLNHTKGGQVELLVSTSDDNGHSWSPPVQVNDPNGPVPSGDRIAVDQGMVIETWEGGDTTTFGEFGSISTDGGQTWGPNFGIGTSYPKSGAPVNCGTQQNPRNRYVYPGNVGANDFPTIAIDPKTEAIVVAYTYHGYGNDPSDIAIRRSTDKGKTWSAPTVIGAGGATQFFPNVVVSPGGVFSLAWYQLGSSGYDVYQSFSLNGGATWLRPQRITSVSSQLPALLPSFDTAVHNCDLGAHLSQVFPGSGLYLSWTDTRDAGPAGDNGVDPNIYVAHIPTSTAISVSVKQTTKAITASGSVVPSDATGSVTATLYRKSGSAFVKVASKTAALSKGAYTATLPHPSATSCKVAVRYGGDTDHTASSATKTFSC